MTISAIMPLRSRSPKKSLNSDHVFLIGDARDIVRKIEDNAIDCIVTSPPYFNQRDYGVKRQIGAEKTLNEYIHNLTALFSILRRKLKEHGTFWLNIGDKYVNGAQQAVPWRVALALVADGWTLRSDIIWHKPNAMPSSVKNRFTVDHEYIFLFTKGEKHFFDQDAVREPHITLSPASRMRGGKNHFGKKGGTPEGGKFGGSSGLHTGDWDRTFHPKGRNKRTVWSIPLSKNRDAHFAVFPDKLVNPCLKAGCPNGGLVLDPFCGTGTVSLVAAQLGMKSINIDIHPRYVEIAKANFFKKFGLPF